MLIIIILSFCGLLLGFMSKNIIELLPHSTSQLYKLTPISPPSCPLPPIFKFYTFRGRGNSSMHYKRNNNNSKKFQQWGLQQSINNWTTMPKRPLSSLLPTHIDHQILTPSEYFLFSAFSTPPGGDKSRSKSYFTPYSQDSWKMVFAMLRDDCYLLFGVFGAFADWLLSSVMCLKGFGFAKKV